MSMSRAAKTIAVIEAALILTALVNASPVTLAWDPPEKCADGSVLTDLAGFRVYMGTVKGVYASQVSVSNTNSITLTNVTSGCSNYFAVTAVTSSGTESDYSEELGLYVPPEVVPSSSVLDVAEGSAASLQVKLDAAPDGTVTASVQRLSGGSPFLGVTDGSVLVFTPANWNSNRTVTLTALYDSEKRNRTASFRISGAGVRPATIQVASVGTGVIVASGDDTDANGIADDWEVCHLGGVGVKGASAADDTDGDGASNLREYVAGTDPVDARSFPDVRISMQGGVPEVSFLARKAEGVGYSGKDRYYTLENCTGLREGGWVRVAPVTDVHAVGQTVSHKAEAGTQTCFYRVEISLR